jgi:hypothetical protein
VLYIAQGGYNTVKKAETDTRKRRNVYIEDDLYMKTAIQAVREGVDNGKIIEEALKLYFDTKE